MSDISRRDVLRTLGLAIVSGAIADRAMAQQVHDMVMGAQTAGGGAYIPVHSPRTSSRRSSG